MDQIQRNNRILVDRMMVIMQGEGSPPLCGEPYLGFNPGTLNYRHRKQEIVRIEKENLYLMHRIEGVKSGYSRERIRPTHFRVPHMGLFPR
ncbi:unnamed protein product, partial [Discosporangium mesarthrocarpum]